MVTYRIMSIVYVLVNLYLAVQIYTNTCKQGEHEYKQDGCMSWIQWIVDFVVLAMTQVNYWVIAKHMFLYDHMSRFPAVPLVPYSVSPWYPRSSSQFHISASIMPLCKGSSIFSVIFLFFDKVASYISPVDLHMLNSCKEWRPKEQWQWQIHECLLLGLFKDAFVATDCCTLTTKYVYIQVVSDKMYLTQLHKRKWLVMLHFYESEAIPRRQYCCCTLVLDKAALMLFAGWVKYSSMHSK